MNLEYSAVDCIQPNLSNKPYDAIH